MEKEKLEKFSNLIKKLEKISLPEIEVLEHKRKLKEKLLCQYSKEKKKQKLFELFKKLAPIGAVAVLLVIVIFTKITSPVYTLSQTKEIALENPEVKQMVNAGAIVADVAIADSKGYVLLQSQPKEKFQILELEKGKKVKEGKAIGALAEIDLKRKRVIKLERVSPEVIPLPKKEKVKEITEKNPKAQKILPKEAEIREIIPLVSPKLRLTKEKGEIKVIPIWPKKAKVIYQLNKKRWEGKIDLLEEKLEELRFLGETEK